MSENTIVEPVDTTLNQSTDPTAAPEVVTPEATPEVDPAEAEKLERDKSIRRMERRIDRKHAEAAEAKARVSYLEEQLRQQAPRPTEEEPAPVTRVQFEQAVAERAKELSRIGRFNDQCDAIAAKGKKEFPDFTDTISSLSADLPLFDGRGQPTAAMQIVLEADNPSALLHYLGKNPDIASELADLTPIQLARRLDRIEREMKPTRSPSSAPKPLEPVKGTAKSDEPPINDTARWIEWSMKQDQLKRKR